MAEQATSSSSTSPLSDDELPLRLIKSESIPPSPNRSESSIDWLPEYSGLSWIAYGASSLLVISHFPSPQQQTLTGPAFRQTIELSSDASSQVRAVAWSPATPSQGDVAAAVGNFVCVFSDTSPNTQASFYWIRVAVLVQSHDIEAIKWTVSGDGIVSAGREVVFWRRNNTLWEIAWKFMPQQPQTMLSTTQGLVATAGTLVKNVESRNVLVCQMDHKTGMVKSDLLTHPQSVSMIQWRPTVSQRAVLLTCCLDGTVRLWSEIDDGRAKSTNRSFHVIAVVEINKSLNGTPGVDMFVAWATETRSVADGGVNFPSATKGSVNDTPGMCEWLIGYGPRMLLCFWAIHCLDDISPLRFPRVSLWKTLDLSESEGHLLQASNNLNIKEQSLFIKAVISRSRLNGPPTMCSLFQLSDNSLGWSQAYSHEWTSNIKDECLSLDGHNGNILQLAIHPYSYEIELAVSLDSSGFLLFWCISTISSFIPKMPALVVPTWKLVGKIATKCLFSVEYTCLRWAPSVLHNYSVLLLGHSSGIDCLMIEIAESEPKRTVHHKLCTIPFTGHNCVDGPTNIFAIPLPSTCRKTFSSNHFMLLGVWMNGFQVLSWKVTLHSDDLSGPNCDCKSEFTGGVVEHDTCRYESSFAGKRYSVVAELCSSKLSDSHKHDQVTSLAVVSPGSLVPSVQQKWYSSNGLYSESAPYQMAVGYSDGSLRFWKSTCPKSSIPHSEPVCLPWELVGMFISHEGPVTAISLSCCGGKIATFSMEKISDSFGTLCIWRPVRLINSGKFLLEDKISLNAAVVALSWFSIGNGQLLLGVCLQNELRVYAQRSFGSQMVGKYSELSETHIWYCISVGSTSPDVKDFVWGPGATPVLVHERYFSLYSRWSSHLDKEHQTIPYVRCSTDNSTNYIGGTATDPICVVFTDCNPCSIHDQPLNGKSKKCKPQLPSKLNITIDYPVCYLFRTKVQQTDSCTIKGPRTLLEVAAKSRGSLPSYHPDVLLLNLYSGNWKQACVAVRHLVECLNLDRTSVQSNKAHNSKIVNHVVPLMLLSTYFEEPASAGLGKRGLLWGNNDSVFSSAAQSQINSSSFAAYNADANDSYNTFSSGSGKSEISGFIETIEKFSAITAITNAERTQMLALIDLLGEISDSNSASAYENLDEPGRRFWVALKFQQLHFRRQFGTLASTNELVVDSGMTAWAFQSDCQDNLLTSFLSNEPSWNEMRNLGVGFWFTNVTQLRTRMEKLARSQFLKKRDPKDCSLLYIALNRIQVLAGLFKMSRDEKDKPLVGFLSRNFQDEKNKSAALKNAYVLMGRHQLELAIAFFLLGGDTSSAISVCARTLGDEQLALIICRLLEGNGGSLERQIINKSLLPAVIERGDCWLASLFEWNLGNYFQSFLRLLGFEKELVLNKSVLRSNQIAFLDPTVGQYCLILATRNFMRNYIGESAAAVLAKWAALMTSIALNRRGLPIESLRCMSSSVSTLEGKEGGSVVDLEKLDIPHGILEESNDTSNWLHGDVAAHMESRDKLDLALHYVSNLIMEHPSWIDSTVCRKPLVCDEEETSGEYKLSLEKFQHKLNTGFAIFEQRYSLNPVDMLNMIIVFSRNNGTLLLGYHILHGYSSQEFLQDDNHKLDSIFWYPPLPRLFLKATQEISCFFARYLMCFSMTYSPPKQSLPVCRPFGAIQSHRLHMWDVYMKRCIHLLEGFKVTLRMYCPNFFTESIVKKTFTAVDLLKYYIIFTSAWLQKNLRGLILTIYPILIASKDQNTPSNIDIEYLRKHLCQNADVITYNSYHDNIGGVSVMCKQSGHERSGELVVSIPEDEKWQIVGACLWRHLFNFTRDLMKSFSDHETNNSSLRSPVKIPPSLYADGSDETGAKDMMEEFMHVPELFSKVLDNTLECIASSHSKHFASVITPKMEKRFCDPTLAWLVKSDRSHSRSSFNIQKQDIDNLCQMNNGDEGSLFGVLWDMSVDPIEICKAFSQNSKSWLHSSIREFPKGWNDVHKDILIEYEIGNTSNHDHERNLSNSAHGESGSPRARRPQDNSGFMRPRQKESALVKVDMYFRNPMEIYKRNGELLETMCVNSINQQQAAVATNRKGILFFEWKDEDVSKETAEYIWSEVDWPQDGWAGSESTPLPTSVSPGIGLGSQKGTHLGLVGATVGQGSFTKSGTNLTDDRTFGILGYSGAGASGLGWGTQEDLEFVDSPATVDNISTRALSSHPSRPFFLAGSSNTHIYLWEFGKKKATATYGVLPAATVPPPYALASIEALQFDHYGQRFVTAALDGTVCTWQLEVGGRSNIHPTESSLCFDRHALDVTYIAASGSVVAAAGYSSDDVNVVVWDTLAPTTTSKASLICHEGGARSVSVFDNNIGSGSISPLIITGGKGGDVGLHDFRFIATGKTKRNRHHNKNEQSTKYSSSHETHSGDSNKLGEQNLKGMLWYIPKAHSGSITKIATIPDTSFFLTGSKDGDVKLWDAKKAELVFHWPKLHERHTFLQPSSRGFGGIVRAAITDIQVFSKGFLTCGGDGTVKLVQIKDFYT